MVLSFWLSIAAQYGCAAANAATPSAAGIITLFPAPDATNVCPDAPLRITLASAASVGSAGNIRIVDAATNTPVATIDVASPTSRQTIGGLTDFQYYPILINARQNDIRQIDIHPPNNALACDKTYYVTIDPQAVRDADGKFAGFTKPTDWRFTTRTAPPAAGSKRLTVAADGTGDFCTVQAAVDFVPAGNTAPVIIFIARGTYNEIVYFARKNAITFLGQDRAATILAYANNNNSNPAGGPYRRGMFQADHCNDITIANLTMHNTTPYKGTQAEAIILNGTAASRAIITDVDLDSFQDTLQINGQAYISHANIVGDVDFMWGAGPCFFEDCTCTSVHSNAYYTQIRNTQVNHGYVYDHCGFLGTAGVTGDVLSRIDPQRFPYSEVVLLDCTLGPSVGPAAWRFDAPTPARGGVAGPAPTAAPNVHFWEFNNRDLNGAPVDTSRRFVASKRLDEKQDAATIANYRNPAYVLGNGWTPSLAPIITTQPANVSVTGGSKVTLTVACAAVPEAAYQWRKNGVDIAGATAADYTIPSATLGDAGSYRVVITNSAGHATSDTANVTVGLSGL
jgi:hypothetical protein